MLLLSFLLQYFALHCYCLAGSDRGEYGDLFAPKLSSTNQWFGPSVSSLNTWRCGPFLHCLGDCIKTPDVDLFYKSLKIGLKEQSGSGKQTTMLIRIPTTRSVKRQARGQALMYRRSQRYRWSPPCVENGGSAEKGGLRRGKKLRKFERRHVYKMSHCVIWSRLSRALRELGGAFVAQRGYNCIDSIWLVKRSRSITQASLCTPPFSHPKHRATGLQT